MRGLLSFRAIDVVVRTVTVEASFALHGSALQKLLVVRYDRCTCRVLRRDFVDAQGLLPEQSDAEASTTHLLVSFKNSYYNILLLLLLTTKKYKSLSLPKFFVNQ